ncbi:DUF6262 family protein [Nocardia sp. alder85J]|uniref:DUF6262 family protein n=1 Tax=Nocardia sp. alder85J TaxID=2862949 RepID=UPI001CD22062|nr:DUF6262 family protein [Nocardia sp. alder85J]MCX4094552.1 DUF6262 family protein [Nocardia sp. alder85J]
MADTMTQGRQADSARRRQRVVKALNIARGDGDDISVSAIARAAGVDRTYIYRHRDLLAQVHAAQTAPRQDGAAATSVTAASLRADLANAEARVARMAGHNKQLEKRLSELLGAEAWRESGLGAPADIDQLQRQVVNLEQQVTELRGQLRERDQELDAARAANRELFAGMNKRR